MSLNAYVGEWTQTSIPCVSEGRRIDAQTIFDLLGGRIRALVLLAGAGTVKIPPDKLADRLGFSATDVKRTIALYVRTGILTRNGSNLNLAENPANFDLSAFLSNCSSLLGFS